MCLVFINTTLQEVQTAVNKGGTRSKTCLVLYVVFSFSTVPFAIRP